MKTRSAASILLLVLCLAPRSGRGEKADLEEAIAARAEQYWAAALEIWDWAEPGYQESKSAERIAGLLEGHGFEIERGVAGIPTAFIATIGAGKPVIAILGEYDALPGLSQEAVAKRKARPGNRYGHACGHHLFGVASAAAAIALAEQIKGGRIEGTLRYYGCPAEEGGGAKVFMVREGLLDDCDAVLHWHPASANSAGDPTNLSRIAVKFRFRGVSAHAAAAPEQARSALDAVALTNHAAELLREHTPDFTRIHHVITAGGEAPNVVPDFAEVFYYVRHPKSHVVSEIYRRLLLCAEAAALATETELEVDYIGGLSEIVPNNTLTAVTLSNLRDLNDLEYTEAELEFCKQIQKTLTDPKPLSSIGEVTDNHGSMNKGSTDVGDVSRIAPTTGFSTVCWAPGTPAHSWQAVAAGGSSIGRKGMLLAARVLAATAWDLFHDPETLRRAREEHERNTSNGVYEPLLEPGQKPPLDYRDPPSADSRDHR